MPLARWFIAMTLPRLIVGLLCVTGPTVHAAFGGSTVLAIMGFVFSPWATLGLVAADQWHGAIEGVWLVGVVVGGVVDFFTIGHGAMAPVGRRARRTAST